MRLRISNLYSLDPDETPMDLTHFGVEVYVVIEEIGQPGAATFRLSVCSPSALAEEVSGTFVSHTLVLDRFSWEAIQERIEKLLMHADSLQTWDEVIKRFL
ncbi:MAG: Imm8 family immunity protein [Bacteroidota bacterium]